MLQNLSVSVLIRTRDIESRFRELLKRISRQTLQPVELVVVDNFSTKAKLEEMHDLLLQAKTKIFGNKVPLKLVPVSDKEFSHSYTTNVGVFVAAGEFVCVTNGHSLPSSDAWLERGALHFRNPEIAGVGGYFTSHEDGSAWERLGYDWGWKKRNELTRAYVKDAFFSTINCIFRRALWSVYPFDEKLSCEISETKEFGGEDYDWALEMQARGYHIIVEPEFTVHHSHGEKLNQLASKHIVWRQIRRKIKSFSRPRKAFTRLGKEKPTCIQI